MYKHVSVLSSSIQHLPGVQHSLMAASVLKVSVLSLRDLDAPSILILICTLSTLEGSTNSQESILPGSNLCAFIRTRGGLDQMASHEEVLALAVVLCVTTAIFPMLTAT